MKRYLVCAAAALLFVPVSSLASGWRIPEQSVDSIAKAGASIASVTHADAAWLNPAKMSFLEDCWQLEFATTYIYLTPVQYDDGRSPVYSDESDDEHFFVPTGFVVSPDFGGARFGLAVTAPYGLAKHWDTGYGKAFVEEFSLRVIEVNPTVSWNFGDVVSVAVGPRFLFAEGAVKSDASVIGREVSRSVETDTVEWGWNAAVNVRPTKGVDLAVTWRSYVDFQFDDDIDLNLMGTRLSAGAELSIPAPAVLSVSAAWDVTEDVTVEVTWDRTFWSEYDSFDMNFDLAIPGNPYEAPVVRDWDDSNAFRFGVSWQATRILTLMAGFAYDQSPVPDHTLDFSVPDAHAWIYSAGGRLQVSDRLELGLSALFDYKEDRSSTTDPAGTVYGEFSNVSALLVTAGATWTF